MTQPLRVRSHQGDYEVNFPASLSASLPLLPEGHTAVVLDRNVARLYEEELRPLVRSRPTLVVEAVEEQKTLGGVDRVVTWLQSLNATRRTTLMAIGGGIVQDLCTFSAHIYYRGIPLLLVPTTLLSMADSCIGAKCGLNLNSFKNQLGVFHSPIRVIVSTAFIGTLNDLDVASGYGELLKLMLTGPPGHLDMLEEAVDAEGSLRNARLPELIFSSLDVKRAVIEEDEYESDRRRVLNFGHTFGHALESVTHHAVPHGLAVAWGVDLANFLAVGRGLQERALFDRVHKFIDRRLSFALPRRVFAEELLAAATHDKKATNGGRVSLVLLEAPGSFQIAESPIDGALEREVADYLEKENVFCRR